MYEECRPRMPRKTPTSQTCLLRCKYRMCEASDRQLHFGRIPLARYIQRIQVSSEWTITAKVGQSELRAQLDLDPGPTTAISPTKSTRTATRVHINVKNGIPTTSAQPPYDRDLERQATLSLCARGAGQSRSCHLIITIQTNVPAKMLVHPAWRRSRGCVAKRDPNR
jgi:hypothetical protein